jgi:ribosomal protein L7Ae-like RNA K-turn-binding protein
VKLLLKLYNLLGLAMRAGAVSSGTVAVKNSLLRNRACLLILSDNISEKTKQSLVARCEKQNISWLNGGDKYRLGNAVGKAYRVAVTVNDEGLARQILKVYAAGDEPNTMGVVEWPK